MKALLKAYQNMGRASQASFNKRDPFLLDGPKPPTWQTPGRLQYYRAENEVYLPDEIKWQIRMPKEFAMRQESLMYNDKVQDQIMSFMGKTIKHDYVQGSRELNLDLTIEEAEKLYSADDKLRALADSGELQALHKRTVDQAQAVQTGYIKVMDQLDRTLQSVSEAEQDIYEDLVDSEIEELRRLDTGLQGETAFNLITLTEGNAQLENYEIVRRVAEQKGDSDVVAAAKSLKSLLVTRAKVMAAKAQITAELVGTKPGDLLGATKFEVTEFDEAARKFGHAAQDEGDASGDDAYSKQYQDIEDGEMSGLLNDIGAYKQSDAERGALYADLDAQALGKDEFRQDLLKHLAGSIVVKEHRIRYQKEQFDRFVASLGSWELKDKKATLREFSHSYSRLMSATTQSSHNYRCHKIEANYDDFGEQTIRPLNATIFFYFFSANRSGKTWAQWMLSSVRYPNDRMRRAYMRFFA